MRWSPRFCFSNKLLVNEDAAGQRAILLSRKISGGVTGGAKREDSFSESHRLPGKVRYGEEVRRDVYT